MAIQDLFSEESDLYLDEVCTWLAFEHDIIISPSALSRNLEQAGLTRKVLQKLAIEHDEAHREEFKDSLQNHFIGDGSEFVVLDETSKNERTYARLYGRAARGKRATLTDVFVRGDRYSLCAAMTVEGYIAARVVEGSYDERHETDTVVWLKSVGYTLGIVRTCIYYCRRDAMFVDFLIGQTHVKFSPVTFLSQTAVTRAVTYVLCTTLRLLPTSHADRKDVGISGKIYD
jgi:hypothetical protein